MENLKTITLTHTNKKTGRVTTSEYVQVHTRLKYFRESKDFEGWRIETEIVDLQDHRIIFKATVKDGANQIRATGHAFEYADNNQINKTSFVENCETSAVGRALGNLGIGIDESYATAEEVAQAIKQQQDEREWLTQRAFDQACVRIQEAKPNIQIKDGDEELELTPAMFVEWLKKKYRMKREYSEGLRHEVEFQKTLSEVPASGTKG